MKVDDLGSKTQVKEIFGHPEKLVRVIPNVDNEEDALETFVELYAREERDMNSMENFSHEGKSEIGDSYLVQDESKSIVLDIGQLANGAYVVGYNTSS